MKKSNVNNKDYQPKVTIAGYTKEGTKWVLAYEYTEECTFEYYNNTINARQFMTNSGGFERHTKTYTAIGFIPTFVNSISPEGVDKKTRKFTFERIERM